MEGLGAKDDFFATNPPHYLSSNVLIDHIAVTCDRYVPHRALLAYVRVKCKRLHVNVFLSFD